MSSRKILVTGANGQLGQELQDIANQYPAFEFLFVGSKELDINNASAISQVFAMHKFIACINCAAYTAVDKAEAEQELALQTNGTAVGNLAKACAGQGAKFVHISTDYVFDGTATQPYSEPDATAPVNFYGATKLAGEKQALENNPGAMIIRTSWVYSHHGKNFVKTMLRLMAEKESINVVADQFGSPTYAADLARAILEILNQDKFQPGIYHYANQGIINWHQFASAIQEIAESQCKVNAITTKDYPTPAARPAYSAFNAQKFMTTFSMEIPAWRVSLEKCINKILNTKP